MTIPKTPAVEGLLSSEELEAIENRVEATTPGPWKFNENGVVTADSVGKIVCCFVMDWARIPDGEDWEFLAHARSDIPRLLSHIKALEASGGAVEMREAAAKLIEDRWPEHTEQTGIPEAIRNLPLPTPPQSPEQGLKP